MSKKPLIKDPYAAREAQKYEDPIPSREFILSYMEKAGKPVSLKALIEELNIEQEPQKEALRRRLRAMERDGQAARNKRGAYAPIKNMGLLKGRFSAHRDGYGFVILHEDDGHGDVFIAFREAQSVFHDDEVLVRVTSLDAKGKREGTIVEVLKRNTQQIVGRYFEENQIGVVEPAGKRIKKSILIPKKDGMLVQSGQFVVVNITQQPTKHTQALGEIIEILGDHLAPGMEIDVAMRSYQLPHIWSQDVLNELKQLPDEVVPADLEGRRDLRGLSLVTIDGEDARDFDDAVYAEKNKHGWRLWVAIADVSHYVRPKTALDNEGYLRGTSVYFPNRVIPMLPEKLSNELCSLNPHVDRLCMVAEMTINEEGGITRSSFYPAVMHSRARLTYTQVAAYLHDKKSDVIKPEIFPHLETLNDLYENLRRARDKRGAIDLDTVETKILFDDNKKIEKIVPSERNVAHKIIEECMLAANVATAKYIVKHKLVSLFRVHELPKTEKVEKFRGYLKELGLKFVKTDSPTPKDYEALLLRINDRPDKNIIKLLLLRTLSQARYSPENVGHFGLAYEAYAHFTSPIRRYPDLFVHRCIKASLQEQVHKENLESVQAMGIHCSDMERRADEATRDVTEWLKCEYMLDKVGGVYEGVVSSVASFGLFVELKEIYVEGMLHIANLGNDYFTFDAARHRLFSEHTGAQFQLGDKLTIRVARVDLDERHIDFELENKPKSKSSPAFKAKPKPKAKKSFVEKRKR